MENDIKTHFGKMEGLVGEFESKIQDKANLERQLIDMKESMGVIENDVKEKVYNETDSETGKKKYTNEEMRKVAREKALFDREDYTKLKKSFQEINKNLENTKIHIEMIRERLRVLYKEADLLTALTNFKAGGKDE